MSPYLYSNPTSLPSHYLSPELKMRIFANSHQTHLPHILIVLALARSTQSVPIPASFNATAVENLADRLLRADVRLPKSFSVPVSHNRHIPVSFLSMHSLPNTRHGDRPAPPRQHSSSLTLRRRVPARPRLRACQLGDPAIRVQSAAGGVWGRWEWGWEWELE